MLAGDHDVRGQNPARPRRRAVLRSGDPEPGGVVRLSKVDNFLAISRDSDCGNGTVQLPSRCLIDKPLERRLLESVTEMQLLSDVLPQIYAEVRSTRPDPLSLRRVAHLSSQSRAPAQSLPQAGLGTESAPGP